jgi:hypothetical protein
MAVASLRHSWPRPLLGGERAAAGDYRERQSMARRLFRMRVRTTRSKLGVWKHLPCHATVTGDIAVATRPRVDAYPVADSANLRNGDRVKPSAHGRVERGERISLLGCERLEVTGFDVQRRRG